MLNHKTVERLFQILLNIFLALLNNSFILIIYLFLALLIL